MQKCCLLSAVCQSFRAALGRMAPPRLPLAALLLAAPSHGDRCVAAQIERIRGMRCWVKGSIRDPAGALLATCEAQLADLQQLWKAQA